MTELFADVTADRGKTLGLWARRAFVTLFALIAVLALAGFAGQRDSETTATANGVTMTLSTPNVVRGGLYYQATIDLTATTAVQYPRVVLDSGWVDGVQVNSIEPAAVSESTRDGRLVLSYGSLQPGDRLKVWLQFQVDPTQPGGRSHAVEFDDRTRPLVRVDRDMKVLP